jgi:sugar/nucleoside kinase (ribokinase family)
MSSVLVIGDALIDNQYYVEALPKSGQDEKINDFRKSVGGSAANTAAALAKQGVKTYFCASVGDDEDGQIFINSFAKYNVDTTLVQQSGKTGFTVTMIERGGERTMLSFRDAGASAMQLSPALEAVIKKVSMVLLSGYMLTEPIQAVFAIAVAKMVVESGGQVALDPSPVIGTVSDAVLSQVLALTDVLLPNEEELAIIEKKVGDLDVPCIAVKMGSKGARLMYDIAEYTQPAQKANIVDTTGAGDAFNAGLIVAMLANEPPQKWLKKAVETAAAVVSKKGAV